MEKTKVSVSGGVSFTGLLQIVFIVLKICGVITWSWWLVLLPTLISVGIFVLALLFVIVGSIIINHVEEKERRF